MRGTQFHLRLLLLIASTICESTLLFAQKAPPLAPVDNTVDDYYGVKIPDPYRWMEAGDKNPRFVDFMKAQNDYTRAVLASLPGRQKLMARLTELNDSKSADVFDVRRLPGNLYFYQKVLVTEEVPKLYMRKGLNGQEKLLVDPEHIMISEANRRKGRNTIAYYEVSDDARYVAVGVMPGGSERDTELHVIETASGREAADVIHRAWDDDVSWQPDNHSFVYGKLQKLPPGAPVTETEQKYRSYLHVLGTGDPEKDPAIFGYDVTPSISVDSRHLASVSIPPKSKFAVGAINTGVSPESSYYLAPVDALGKPDTAWRHVADFPDDVSDIAVYGDDLYLRTFKNAPRYKIIRTSVEKPDLGSAEIIVPPGQAVVTGMTAAEDALYVQLLDGGISRILRVAYGPKPKVEVVTLPLEGAIRGLSSDPRLPGVLFAISSWTRAHEIYAYDPTTRQMTDTGLQPVGPFDAPANLESVEVKAPSYDGTLVPLSIVYQKGLKLDRSNPTLLGGYGSYGYSWTPSFDRLQLAWYERGGVAAVCHARGGGEYGEEWHLAGKQATKPNTWRDFNACAQYLIDKKYTSPGRLSGQGGSAGGILIGRAITERPDLFGAAVINVGILDTLRFETTANGVPNIPEFGSTKTEAGFQALYAMSAYAHVNNKTPYPAVLLTTGMNDPRVDPWVSAKMAARLQAATTSGKPILLHVDYAGGHGGIGQSTSQLLERIADTWSFLLWQSGDPQFQPAK